MVGKRLIAPRRYVLFMDRGGFSHEPGNTTGVVRVSFLLALTDWTYWAYLTTIDPLCMVASGNHLHPAQLADEQTRCYQHTRCRGCITCHYVHWLVPHET